MNQTLQDLCGITADFNKTFDVAGITERLQGGPVPFTPADSWGALLLAISELRQDFSSEPYDLECLAELFMSSWWYGIRAQGHTVKLLGWTDTEQQDLLDDSWRPSGGCWVTNAVSRDWELCSHSANDGMLVALRYTDEGYGYDVYLALQFKA